MSSTLFLIDQLIKSIKKIDLSNIILVIAILLINIYGFYQNILGKIITIVSIIYLVLNDNLTLGIISFLIILLLNNRTIETFENKQNSKNEKNETNDKENDVNDTKVELNDTIATFKTQHCKNGKLLDKDGKIINVSDISTVFPHIKFNIENEKFNPCEDNCDFKITSEIERISVEEKLRPTNSSQVSSE